MSKRRTYHVTRSSEGAWRVKAAGGEKASAVCDTKAEAVDRAKELAKNQALGQVVVHGRDNEIQAEYTYGKDPCPPKG